MMPGRTSKNKVKNIGKSDNLYLGVDGGGTQTLIVLLDEFSNVVAEGLSGASNPMRVGIEKAVTNISEAVNIACDKSNRNITDIVSAALGLAGVRREDFRLRIRERIARHLRINLVEVVTDADIALYGYTHHASEARIDLEPFSHLRAWFGRVEQQAGYIEDVVPYAANAAPGAGQSIYG